MKNLRIQDLYGIIGDLFQADKMKKNNYIKINF